MHDLIKALLTDESFTTNVKTKLKTIKPNKKIIQQGIVHEYLYLIETGQVRIIVNGHLNKDVDLHPGMTDLGVGEIFGEFGLFDDEPASADVCAVTEVKLIAIEKKSLRRYMDSHKVKGYIILMEMFSKLVCQIRHSNNTVVSLYCWGIKNHSIDKYLS